MGLRAMAQTVGSTMSLYIISPEMTGATLVLMPVIIGVGTFLGSFLRAMSKETQQQVKFVAKRGVYPNCTCCFFSLSINIMIAILFVFNRLQMQVE